MRYIIKKHLFLLLTILFVGAGLALADTVVILLGDVNDDGLVNVTDMTAITNYIHGDESGVTNLTAANVNRDELINVTDLNGITNIVHYGNPDQESSSILFFTETSYEKSFGDEPFSPTIVRAGSTGAITYASDNTDVATVDATTGVVTIVGAGTATITTTLPADDNFTEATAEFIVTVSVTMPTIATTPAAVSGDLTYTGVAQNLTTAGEATGGTVKYFVTTTDEAPATDADGWTTTVPQATDAGTYYVWYYVDGDANYNDTEVAAVENSPKTIAKKATNSIADEDVSVAAATYNGGEAVTPAVTITIGETEVPVTEDDFDIVYSNNTAAGTASVTITPKADGNFTGDPITKEFAIGKSDITDLAAALTTAPAAKKDGEDNQTATGSALELITAGATDAGTLKYKMTTTNEQPAKDADGWSTDIPTATDAGTYYVWYYIVGNDNYNDSEICETPITVTIEEGASSAYPVELSSVTSAHMGNVVASDGKVYENVDAASSANVTALAMIAYVSSQGHGLAYGLEDLTNGREPNSYGTHLVFKGGTNCDEAVLAWALEHPVGNNAQGWRVPSLNDYKYMFEACGGSPYTTTVIENDYNDIIECDYGNFRTMLETCGGTPTNANSGKWYWTSTVVAAFPEYMYRYTFYTTKKFTAIFKEEAARTFYLRPVFAF